MKERQIIMKAELETSVLNRKNVGCMLRVKYIDKIKRLRKILPLMIVNILLLILGNVTGAHAFTVPDHISINISPFGGLSLMLCGVFALYWVLRKCIKFINRS